jgi:alpha/beta superfamily hydrolase
LGLSLFDPAADSGLPFSETHTYQNGKNIPKARKMVYGMTATTALAEPKRLVLLPRADHFFAGQLEPMHSALAAWLTDTFKEQL